MNKNIRKFISIILSLTLMLAGSDAMAGMFGGTITYGPLPQSVPTLSGSMLMVLALLFAIVAFRVLRAHSASKPLASLVAVGVLALAASQNQLIQDAYAVVIYEFSNPAGATFTVIPGSEFPITNTSGVPQRIISVTPNTNTYPTITIVPTAPTQCVPGLVVQNNNSCNVRFDTPA